MTAWPADKVQRWPIGKLIPNARNARTHSAEQVDQIAASIREWGWTNPVLVSEDGTIIAGHGRVLGARKLGLTDAPVMVATGWTKAQIKAYALADNKLGLNAGWDDALLSLEIADLQELEFNLDLIGFSPEEITALNFGGHEGLTDPDDTPDVPVQPVSMTGDVWLLGRHRLLCGDSTSGVDVRKVLGPVQPHLMVTDPPYGVEYDPGWRKEAGLKHDRKRLGKVANDNRADWRDAWALFPGSVGYVWHAGRYASIVQDSLTAVGFEVRAQIIWAKDRFALSRGHYHWQHEPCQPAGTMVQKVIERGAGSQPAKIEEVPIESLRIGDVVVSYNPYESVIRRRGREITRFGERQFDGLMHAISAAGRVTRATPEHRFSVRLNPDAADKQVVYLMRRGDWWRVGRVGLFNTRGFGLSTRLADNKAEEAWIISVHNTPCEAQCAEQVLSCRYGIPTTHWEVDCWAKAPERTLSAEMIAGIYAKLDSSALTARATLLLRDHRLDRDHPLITGGERLLFSRRATRLVRACNVFAQIMQVPKPAACDEFSWVTVTGNDATPFSGPVYSIDVDRDLHHVADGLVTHNCWYAVRQGPASWHGDRKQSTLWQIPAREGQGFEHGTQKAVECMKRPIENNSSSGQAIYEPFSGSGTTIIAAAMTGRSCHAIELLPQYVDVAVQRWQAFTGETVKLEADGRSFDAVAAERGPTGE